MANILDKLPKGSQPKAKRMLHEIYQAEGKVEEGLWTFARVQGVEPTNNAVERALRHAVIWRRISGGTDSAEGSRFVERMLSVVATCRQQEINVLDYLTRCYQAHLDGRPAPSLVPAASNAQAA